MPCNSAVKMLELDLSFHDFLRSREGMKIEQEEDGGRVLVKEPSVKAITSGGPILARRELKIDAAAVGLAFV
jgi:hypothetical protein